MTQNDTFENQALIVPCRQFREALEKEANIYNLAVILGHLNPSGTITEKTTGEKVTQTTSDFDLDLGLDQDQDQEDKFEDVIKELELIEKEEEKQLKVIEEDKEQKSVFEQIKSQLISMTKFSLFSRSGFKGVKVDPDELEKSIR